MLFPSSSSLFVPLPLSSFLRLSSLLLFAVLFLFSCSPFVVLLCGLLDPPLAVLRSFFCLLIDLHGRQEEGDLSESDSMDERDIEKYCSLTEHSSSLWAGCEGSGEVQVAGGCAC